MENIRKEIERRRTFAIISHPDAGKTTLTEKLLLYGGAIREAGSVKARKAARHATSDWMEIEKQRGISVTSSVMQFNYEGFCINILDTPGHQDFSEDTYRTLMAADSAVMVIDGAKGVEAQTKKLFEVCSLRGIPVFTFINKMDRETRDPFELLQEIEDVLGIRSVAMNWPMGSGQNFQGIYDRESEHIMIFSGGKHGSAEAHMEQYGINDERVLEIIDSSYMAQLYDDVELMDVAGNKFDLDAVSRGALTPVFFGSALTNFGVEPFLEKFLQMTKPPLARKSDKGIVSPFEDYFSAFVFKIQANMNPQHRDRIAFMRIVSGKFEKGMEIYHMEGECRIKLSQPQQFLAQDREIIEEAYAGDIIGVFDPGIFSIGDTLCPPSNRFKFEPIPAFAPELFARIRPMDTMKRKQFVKGISQIAQEGAIQVYREDYAGMEEIIAGVVGTLQFEVLEYRLKNEYGVEIRLDHLPYRFVRWIDTLPQAAGPLSLTSDSRKLVDMKNRDVIIFSNEWGIAWALDHNKGLALKGIGN